ncbi:MAG: ribonuclease H-like domain-containing protein [Planctomycetota bacterium]
MKILIRLYEKNSLCVLIEEFKQKTITQRPLSPESEKRQNSPKISVSILTPQILILLKSRPDIYHFLAEYCSFQKNIGPIEDSTSVSKIIKNCEHIGFEWRDQEPSGEASIEWYHRWIETEDLQIRQRILD